ncbi:MAG: UDP-N-acetylglucosamine 2-epimerase (non-hydrolyzing) [Victivallales bacterium]|nr:UDP-N-acetylglucosamine 2-epimerase (non-hydrolyzing) [Victivallales bacterium]
MAGKKLKVMTVLGTRPEIIRLAAVISTLEKFTRHVLVHTGQNYDYELNQIFFDELDVSKPDHFLNVDTSSLGKTLGQILIKTEDVILKEKPDAFLVLGDTNSAVSLMMAKRMKIPTYHMEAGNRSFDPNVPEETNRKLVDHLADFNLVYTEHARRHLLSEGLSHRFIYLTGSPMKEVLMSKLAGIEKSDILEKLELTAGKYFIVSFHREENVDNPDSLRQVISCLQQLYGKYKLPIVISTHPRTRNRLRQLNLNILSQDIRFLKPFGFFDYNKLQMNAFCAISDSGTISEESAILNFPAVTLRNSLERPEALDAGSIMLTGLDPDILLNAVGLVTGEQELFPRREIPVEYTVENTSLRVTKFIIGTARLAKRWENIEDFSRYYWEKK